MRAVGEPERGHWLTAGCSGTVVGLLALLAFSFLGVTLLTPALVTGALAALAIAGWMHHRSSVAHRAAVADAARAPAVVEEATFDVAEAVAVEEFEDEGLSYYLRLDDGRVLFLSGQYLYDPADEGRFPSRRVTIVRTVRPSGDVLDLRCSGEHVAPSVVLPPFSEERNGTGDLPEDGAVLEVDWADVLAGKV